MSPDITERIETFEANFLMRLARQSLVNAVLGTALSNPDPGAVPIRLTRPRGCFVTLMCDGKLRGCIGNVIPSKPLFLAVLDNAAGAAQRDPRFPAVSSEEATRVEIQLSVLSNPRPLAFQTGFELLSCLVPGRDGVILKVEGRLATFLPQVWKEIPGKVEFLERLCEKAGCEFSAWRRPGVEISTYETERFSEFSLLEEQPNQTGP